MLFSTSQDLLFVVLSVCIASLTVFLCWLLYQAVRFLKNANKIIEEVTEKLELINEGVQFMREKVDGVSRQMSSVSGLLGGIVEKFVLNKLSSKLEEKINEKKETSRRKK